MKTKRHVKVRRIADRRYRYTDFGESGRLIGVDLICPAEYGVFVGGEQVARIIKAGDGWRVVVPTERSRFGVAVSPVGLNSFKNVKHYALERFALPLRNRRLRARSSHV